MKAKKTLLFLSVVPILFSCGEASIAGDYSFQLGKDTGTHFGANLKLTDESFAHDTRDDLKKFNLTISIKNGGEEQGGVAADLLSIFKDTEGKATIPGYYAPTDEILKSGERKITVGLDFNYIVEKTVAVLKEQTGKELDIDPSSLGDLNDSNIIEGLLFATVLKDTVNFYIPVSPDDALLQLYWYGIDLRIRPSGLIDLLIETEAETSDESVSVVSNETSQETSGTEEEAEKFIEVVEVTAHEPGTTPTADDVAKINETFATDHKGCMVTTFRAFHQVKLGLSKK